MYALGNTVYSVVNTKVQHQAQALHDIHPEVQCLKCEKKMPSRADYADFHYVSGVVVAGYGSQHDGEAYLIFICDTCLDTADQVTLRVTEERYKDGDEVQEK